MASFQVYTDGSCFPNGFGSWAYLILKDDETWAESAGPANSTNSNRMEFQAAVMALMALPEGSKITLWTDSRVLLDAVQNKMNFWKSNQWRRKSGRPVVDLDLVQALDQMMSTHQIEWRWVRAHSGNPHNEYCDQLCRKWTQGQSFKTSRL